MQNTASAALTLNASTRPDHFFAHHGFWAPGVRLFRRLSFRTKALLISVVFLAPLVVVSAAYLRHGMATEAHTRRELAGIAFAREAQALLEAVQQQRLAAVQGRAGDAAALTGRQGKLVQAHAGMAALVPGEMLEVIGANIDKATKSTGSSMAAYKRYTQAVQVTHKLLAKTVDASGLANDPEADTRRLIQVGLADLPLLLETALAQVDLALATQGGAPPAMVAAQIGEQRALGTYLDGQVRDALDAVIAARPELGEAVAYARTQEALAKVGEATSGAGEEGFKPDTPALLALREQLVRHASALDAAVLDALTQRIGERARAVSLERNLILGLLGASLLLAAYMFLAFSRVMQGGLNEVSRHLRAMTDGDLTTSPRPWGRDEAARLMLDLREMQNALRGIVRQVRESSEDIVDASRRIAGDAGELATRTEQSAAALQRSTQAMEQIGSTVRLTAEGAGQACSIGRSNAEAAERGRAVIAQVIDTMQGIQGSSKKIGEITGVIDGIAFQTNILALNAAVEAARAGESGRGFAVVAGEVRALARRSADAAREIKGLIERTLEQVNGGTQVVQRAGSVIGEVVTASQRVNSLLEGIAGDTRVQADGVLDASRGVQEVDAATRTNVSLVQATEATAGALQEQARVLTTQVDRFRLPQGA